MAEPTMYRVEGKIIAADSARAFNGEELKDGVDVKLEIAGTPKPAMWRVKNATLEQATELWQKKIPVEITGTMEIRENKEKTRVFVGPGPGNMKALAPTK